MVGVTKIMVSMFSLCDSLKKNSGQGGGGQEGGVVSWAPVFTSIGLV